MWTWTGHGPGFAPADLGDRETLALALPTGSRGAIEVADVDCALISPAELAALALGDDLPAAGSPDRGHSAPMASAEPSATPRPLDAGSSLRAWRTVLRQGEPVDALPIAAHAVPDAVGTAIVSADRALRTLLDTEAVAADLATTLHADLRPYQARGIGWLTETVEAYGGAVLADEMGLGKTVQAIGFLLARAAAGAQLVVCPTSLVGNWAHEITRFAPELRPISWRGGELAAAPGDIVVVGYPMLRLHGHLLAEQNWATAVFDEAQALKNPRTQLAKAARALTSPAKVALTGTPVENHLEELWALLHLVAPRLFAHRGQFRRRFVRPIQEGSAAAAARLRDTIEPVVLARKKFQVAAALPAKIHTDLLCDLTAEQEKLYDQLLERAIDDGFGSGAQRQSRVLAALTALKQVCNHPGLITGDLAELPGRSGKLDLCTDIVATNLETASPTLIFTQYRQTGELLVRHLAEQFGVTAPFFHGGLNQDQRAAIVRDFQSADGPPVLVLSLRAAGTGLTLTRAADVVHFDRWWNPAVEAQASDRAHRIGQTRTVTITTLTSGTTVEEHIAGMHDRKSALTDLSDSAGIAALARLDDDQLVEILRRKREN
ncbi:Helicase conserved C-terminal domain-containing protein [Nocardia amikacinitolerans]|uniref:DEAD/DEAH box helicase n=1 Tax=Nocardia amikacinitolerans TaxID=756689 RepID=UPI000ACFEABD|nr:Helicase conserved C-terminal domain-containing protein [Nocardia amikacinitolerans]